MLQIVPLCAENTSLLHFLHYCSCHILKTLHGTQQPKQVLFKASNLNVSLIPCNCFFQFNFTVTQYKLLRHVNSMRMSETDVKIFYYIGESRELLWSIDSSKIKKYLASFRYTTCPKGSPKPPNTALHLIQKSAILSWSCYQLTEVHTYTCICHLAVNCY